VRYEEADVSDSDIVIVSYGITSRIAKTAVELCKKQGIKAGYFRPVTLSPFPNKRLGEIADMTKRFLVAELNMGQMVGDVKLATECKKPVDFYGRTGGMMPAPEDICKAVVKILNGLNE
jgi:2-oxoglutarate ferredoxin oxidoreductase subunit alpha